MKTLKSGIQVDSEEYYRLLEFKDKTLTTYIMFCNINNIPQSINNCNKKQFNQLIDYMNS